jgi:hypothetical protein
MDIVVRKKHFVRILEERLFLRFHLSLILIGTALVGLLASKILLIAHVDNIVIRYPVAVIVSYLCFFGFMKLWLSYVTSSSVRKSYDARDALTDAASGISDLSEKELTEMQSFDSIIVTSYCAFGGCDENHFYSRY